MSVLVWDWSESGARARMETPQSQPIFPPQEKNSFFKRQASTPGYVRKYQYLAQEPVQKDIVLEEQSFLRRIYCRIWGDFLCTLDRSWRQKISITRQLHFLQKKKQIKAFWLGQSIFGVRFRLCPSRLILVYIL